MIDEERKRERETLFYMKTTTEGGVNLESKRE